MSKVLLIISFLLLCTTQGFSQKKAKEDPYQEFKFYRNTDVDKPKHITKMLALLTMTPELSIKQKTNVRYHLGRMYEELEKPDSASVYYNLVLKDEPDYEVVHRALGFIYLEKTKSYVEEINKAKKENNAAANTKAFAGYKLMVQKAIPHFEKYQACAPDDETLAMLNNLYKSIKDTQAITTLDARLKVLAKRCVTMLDDE